MHFSEDDLREALKRQEPGSGFTQRVMARVNQARVEGPVEIRAEGPDEIKRGPAVKKSNGAFLAWWKLRPAWSFAVVAILLLAFGLGGYQYSEYHHREEMKVAEKNRQRLEQAEAARDQAILALEIARSKLNHVLQHAQLSSESSDNGNEKIRRQRL
jgi:hypothetical protein